MHKTILKSINSSAKIYPNRDAFNVTLLNNDNTRLETTMLKAEANLLLYLKLIKKKLTSIEMDNLTNLIEEYGSECHETGDFDATYEG